MQNKLKKTLTALVISLGIFLPKGIDLKQDIDEEMIEMFSDEEIIDQITIDQNTLAKEYLEKNFEKLLMEQENKLGIIYPSRPALTFDCEDGPEYTPNKGAVYLPEKKEICIYLEKNDLIKFTGTEDPFMKSFVESRHRDTADVNKILWHELGHYYTHLACEKLGVEDFFWEKSTIIVGDLPKNLGKQVLSEGIARYFEKKTAGEEETTFKQSDWSTDAFSVFIKAYSVYEGGYSLVREIMDEYGADASLEYFILNPIVLENPRIDVPKYKLKAFQDLREETKSKR